MNDKEFFKQLGAVLSCEPAALKAVEEEIGRASCRERV